MSQWHQRQTNPKDSARFKVRYAVRKGVLVRGSCALSDGTPCTGVIEGHHEDYSKPLDVIWLCRWHHAQVHTARRLGEPDPLAAVLEARDNADLARTVQL